MKARDSPHYKSGREEWAWIPELIEVTGRLAHEFCLDHPGERPEALE